MTPASRQLYARGMLGLLAGSILGITTIYWQIYGYEKMFGDFATFRAASLQLLQHNLSGIYDVARLKGLFAANDIKDFNFFLYPPFGLLLVWPLGLLAPVPGLVLWSVAQLALLGLVLRMEYFRRMLPEVEGGVKCTLLVALALVAFSLQNLFFGQVAGFCTVLFLLVFAWRQTRPALAGVMLGLFAFKPQLGIVLPLLLLAERNWKVLAVAMATALALTLLSLALWGGGLWQDYVEMLSLRGQFMAAHPTLTFFISMSVYAALRNLGLSAQAALACQMAVTAGIVIWLWPSLRGKEEAAKLLLVSLAAFLITPYTLIYDMPLLILPFCLFLRRAETGEAKSPELLALLLLTLVPLVTIFLQIFHIPYSVIAIFFAFSVARRLDFREQPLR